MMPQLQAFELPFTYAEAGETKTALVKVKVCHRCAKKLLFKPGQEETSERVRNAESEHRDVKSEQREDDGRSSVKREHGSRQERRNSGRGRSRSPDRETRRAGSKSTREKYPIQDRYGRR